MDRIAECWKAVVAALVAGAGVAVVALQNDGTIDTVEWIIVGVAVITGGGTVWAVPNKERADPS